jgi:hypothetical protein
MFSLPFRGRAGAEPRRSALEGIDLAGMLRERARTLAHFAGQACPLTRLVPIPRAIPLGGSVRVVAELRLRDLAALQAWLEDAEPDPLEDFPALGEDPDPATRPARLHAAWEAAGTWPARLGTDRGGDLLASPGGRAYLLSLCLARGGDPCPGLAESLLLLDGITPTQWGRLIRIAYGVTPREWIAAELAPDRSPPKPVDYAKAFDQLLEYRGLTYDQAADLTLSQWRLVCSGGKPAEKTAEYATLMRRVRDAFRSLGLGG